MAIPLKVVVLDGKCPRCQGKKGYYWDAPVYHNERFPEWMTCPQCEGRGTLLQIEVKADEG